VPPLFFDAQMRRAFAAHYRRLTTHTSKKLIQAPTSRGLYHAIRCPTIISNRRFGFAGVSSGLMAMPASLPVTTRKRGNPNWGRSGSFPLAKATEFELQVRYLHLAPEAYLLGSASWLVRAKQEPVLHP
jgi:hypothetical protein